MSPHPSAMLAADGRLVAPDAPGSAAHRHMADHLTGPLQGGAVESDLALDGGGRAVVDRRTRHPMVLVRLDRSLPGAGPQALALEVTVTTPGGEPAVLAFPPGTEEGAHLPGLVPPVDPVTAEASPFSLAVSAIEVRGGRRSVVADPRATISVRLLEGLTGRLLHVLGAEKARIRRTARELVAIRTLDGAHGDALDRLGAELAVPRFGDALRYVPPERGSATFGRFRFAERAFGAGDSGGIVTDPRREPDAEYRGRLAVYRPWLHPTPAHVRALLNGPGEATDANRGLPAGLGVTERFTVRESPRQAALAIRLVAVGDPALREGFDAYLRSVWLTWLGDGDAAASAHAGRFLPGPQAERESALRARLRSAWQAPADAAVAPRLAAALDLVARCRRALGGRGGLRLLRGQDVTAGSRYELGLGADVAPLDTGELAALARRLRAGAVDLPPRPTADEPDPDEVAAALAGAEPADPAADPDGGWLLRACGLRTVHRVGETVLYVSHVPTFGLVVTGPGATDRGETVELGARYHAAGEPGSHALVVSALDAAAREWADLGRDAWTVLPPELVPAAWRRAVATPAAAAEVLDSVGLPVVGDPRALTRRLRRVPRELTATVRLPATTARRIAVGRPEAADDLRDLSRVLGGHGFSSLLVLVAGPDDVLAVAGAVSLPLAGLNLAERAAARFRWYAVPLWSGDAAGPRRGSGRAERRAAEIGYMGARTTFTPSAPGLYAVVALGQIRAGDTGTEPYEIAVDLPAGATLSLRQYEHLMNLLAHAHPMGTRVDTSAIRRHHVDLDGDGVAEPLTSGVSRSYRQFRRTGFAGRTPGPPTAGT